jgi:two-component system nitrate/nitrite response regulator NarL
MGIAQMAQMGCISIIIADRHPVVLWGLSDLLGGQCDFKIAATCSDGACCIEALRNLTPDIGIVDVALPGLSGVELLSIVNSENLPTRLLFFAASEQHSELAASLAINGHSILSKEVTPEVLLQSLRQIAEGRDLVSPPLSDPRVLRDQSGENVLTVLTERERQIMRLVSEGLSNKEIGRRLNITDGTIKVHLHHIFQKLQVSNRTVLAALAIAQTGSTSSLPPENEVPHVRRGD